MLRKKKRLPFIVGGLGAVALTTVGFSAWLVSAQLGTTELGNVTVNVGTVNDDRLAIKLTDVANKSVTFDANETDGTGGKISKATNSLTENLEFTIGFTLGLNGNFVDGSFLTSNLKSTTPIKNLFNRLVFTIASNDSENYNTLFANNEVAVHPFGGNTNTLTISMLPDVTGSITAKVVDDTYCSAGHEIQCTLHETNQTIDVAATFKYDYGSFFEYKNPVAYKGANLNQAITNLQNLYKLNSDTLTLTVSTDKAA